jgi:hypothetical protein
LQEPAKSKPQEEEEEEEKEEGGKTYRPCDEQCQPLPANWAKRILGKLHAVTASLRLGRRSDYRGVQRALLAFEECDACLQRPPGHACANLDACGDALRLLRLANYHMPDMRNLLKVFYNARFCNRLLQDVQQALSGDDAMMRLVRLCQLAK